MNPHHRTFISLERLDAVLQLEPLLFVLLLAVTAWLFYKLFLKELSPERHRNLRALFKNLFWHSLTSIVFLGLFEIGNKAIGEQPTWVERILPYIGLLAVVWTAIVFIKTCRIIAFEYLFLLNMQVGVPLLIVNFLTLFLVLVVGGWILAAIFQFEVASVLATSAMVSIVLGLALQETLGNLFAGVALQLDKPYSIGDWVEVMHDSQKVLGRVQEISWRATVLIATTDEVIIIPNRLMGQSQISNYSGKQGPVLRSQIFRLSYGQDIERVKKILLQSIRGVPYVRHYPQPSVLVMEGNENWILLKLFYYPEDFGKQFSIADNVLRRALDELHREGIVLAGNRLWVEKTASTL